MARISSAGNQSFRTSSAIIRTVALIVLVPACTSAEPFAITAGRLGFGWDSSIDFVGISGPDFSVPIADSNPEDFGLPGLDIEHLAPSAGTLPVSGHMVMSVSGPVTVGGEQLSDVYYMLFDLTFTGNAVSAQATDDGSAGTGPFRATGLLTLVSYSFEPVFQHAVTGQGLATVGFRPFYRDGTLRPFATYVFEPTVTPEPGTLLLAACGLGAFLRTARSRRRQVTRFLP